MFTSNLLVGSLALTATIPSALAWPGMTKVANEIMSRGDDFDSFELLGDLLTLKDKELSRVGKDIKGLLQGKGKPESNEVWVRPLLSSALCAKDTCCVWDYIKDDMTKIFRSESGRCTGLARSAVRLGFHDAGSWSKEVASEGGGADGSICINNSEINQAENNGLQAIVKQTQQWYAKWHDQLGYTQVTYADLIQMGANVATVVCPLGPRVKSYVGRKDSAFANHHELLPSAADNADHLIELFKNKTIYPHGLTALVGAHTTSQQFFFNTTRAGDPQDSTPGVWDVKFYGQVLNPNSPARVFKFPSDISLSQHPSTRDEWQKFTKDQNDWNEDYAREYIRLSLLGVNNINTLTECTKVLPQAIRGSFRPKDQDKVEKWLGDKKHNKTTLEIATEIFNGTIIDELL